MKIDLKELPIEALVGELKRRYRRGTIFAVYSAVNGWVAEEIDDEGRKIVGEEIEDEHEAFCSLLQGVTEHFGPSSGRYSEKRIRVITLPGDKWSGDLSPGYQQQLEELRDEISELIRPSEIQG